jgi:hypothetical protein
MAMVTQGAGPVDGQVDLSDLNPEVVDCMEAMGAMLCPIQDMVQAVVMSGANPLDILAYAERKWSENPRTMANCFATILDQVDDRVDEPLVDAMGEAFRRAGFHPGSVVPLLSSSYYHGDHAERLGVDATFLRGVTPGGGFELRKEALDHGADTLTFPEGILILGDLKVDSAPGVATLNLNGATATGNVVIYGNRDLVTIHGPVRAGGSVQVDSNPKLTCLPAVPEAEAATLNECPLVTAVPDMGGKTPFLWSGATGIRIQDFGIDLPGAYAGSGGFEGLLQMAKDCGPEDGFQIAMGTALTFYDPFDPDRAVEEAKCERIVAVLAEVARRHPWAVASAFGMTGKDRFSRSLADRGARDANNRRLIAMVGVNGALGEKLFEDDDDRRGRR